MAYNCSSDLHAGIFCLFILDFIRSSGHMHWKLCILTKKGNTLNTLSFPSVTMMMMLNCNQSNNFRTSIKEKIRLFINYAKKTFKYSGGGSLLQYFWWLKCDCEEYVEVDYYVKRGEGNFKIDENWFVHIKNHIGFPIMLLNHPHNRNRVFRDLRLILNFIDISQITNLSYFWFVYRPYICRFSNEWLYSKLQNYKNFYILAKWTPLCQPV